MPQPPDERQRQLVRLGFELQSKEQLESDRKVIDDALIDAALQTGLSPEFLAKAEQELARREAAAAQKARGKRRRLVLGVAILGGALIVAPLGYSAFFAPAPEPWTQTFDEPGSLGLELSAGTQAQLEWREEAGRGQVAVVNVQNLEATQLGTYAVNLEAPLPPDVTKGREVLTLDLRGTGRLPAASVYLHGGPNERWRSPPLSAPGEWTTHRLPLRSFEYQRWEAGSWHAVDWSKPEDLTRLSLKLGGELKRNGEVSGPGQSGELFIDALRLE